MKRWVIGAVKEALYSVSVDAETYEEAEQIARELRDSAWTFDGVEGRFTDFECVEVEEIGQDN